MDAIELLNAIKNIDKSCMTERTTMDIQLWSKERDYKKFYERIMGLVELAEEIKKPKKGGMVSS